MSEQIIDDQIMAQAAPALAPDPALNSEPQTTNDWEIACMMQMCQQIESTVTLEGKQNFLPQIPPSFINRQQGETVFRGKSIEREAAGYPYVSEQLLQVR